MAEFLGLKCNYYFTLLLLFLLLLLNYCNYLTHSYNVGAILLYSILIYSIVFSSEPRPIRAGDEVMAGSRHRCRNSIPAKVETRQWTLCCLLLVRVAVILCLYIPGLTNAESTCCFVAAALLFSRPHSAWEGSDTKLHS